MSGGTYSPTSRLASIGRLGLLCHNILPSNILRIETAEDLRGAFSMALARGLMRHIFEQPLQGVDGGSITSFMMEYPDAAREIHELRQMIFYDED